MRSRTTSGWIVWDDELGIQYRICRLDQTVWEDDSFEYVFTPNYRVIDMLPIKRIGGIPGLDLELRRERYVRKNLEPVFMTERSPSLNRVDLWDLLNGVGLDHYDRLEWLIRTDTSYAGDDLYVVRYEEPGEFHFDEVGSKESRKTCTGILSALASGGRVSISGVELTDNSASAVGRTLRFILESDMLADPEWSVSQKVGRKKKNIDEVTLRRAKRQIAFGHRTAEQVAEELGVSKSTLYRRMRESGL